jgi:hypothetical protein
MEYGQNGGRSKKETNKTEDNKEVDEKERKCV